MPDILVSVDNDDFQAARLILKSAGIACPAPVATKTVLLFTITDMAAIVKLANNLPSSGGTDAAVRRLEHIFDAAVEELG